MEERDRQRIEPEAARSNKRARRSEWREIVVKGLKGKRLGEEKIRIS